MLRKKLGLPQPSRIENLSELKNYSGNGFKRYSDYAKAAGGKIKNELGFYASTIKADIIENAKNQGIPTDRSYWREHPVDAFLTLTSSVLGGSILASNLYVASDEKTRLDFSKGTVTEGVGFFPLYRRYVNPNSPDYNVPSKRPLAFGDYLSLVSPLLLFGIPLAVEGVRYHRWKKSIEKINKQANQS